MGVKFANSAYATLASSITSSATSITLTTGQGARFPSLSGGDYFYATLIDTSNNLEIVKCTARSTDVLTVVRGQESTTARAYSAGDRIELRITAQGLTDAAPVQSVAGRTGAVTLAAADVSGLASIATSGSANDLSSGTIAKARMYTGAVLQVVSYTLTSTATGTVDTSVNTFGNALSLSITPSATSSKILILVSVNKLHRPDKDATGIRILRDGTFIFQPSSYSSSTLLHSAAYNSDAENTTVENMNFLDSPSTTSAITYAVGLITHSSHSGGFNLSQTDNGASYCPRAVSTITALEIKG